MSDESDTANVLMTRKQKSFLGSVALLVGIIAAFQSYGILPYEMRDVKTRIDVIEKHRAEDRDIIVTLNAQLTATAHELEQLRLEIRDFRKDMKTIK